jgi:hypothetical protein
VTYAPTERSRRIYPLPNRTILSHGLPHNTIINAPTRALQNVNKRKNIQCCQLKFIQCSRNKQFLFLSFLMYSNIMSTTSLCMYIYIYTQYFNGRIFWLHYLGFQELGTIHRHIKTDTQTAGWSHNNPFILSK